jgi:hypothetical protein
MVNDRTKWKQLLAKVKEFKEKVNEDNVEEVEKELDEFNKNFLQREQLYSNNNSNSNLPKLWIVEKGKNEDTEIIDIRFSATPEYLSNNFKGGLNPNNIIYWGFDEGMSYKVAQDELKRLKEEK